MILPTLTICQQRCLKKYSNFLIIKTYAKLSLFAEDGEKLLEGLRKRPQVKLVILKVQWKENLTTHTTLNCFHLSLTGMISCIILAEGAIVEVLTGEFGTKKLPNLPSIIISSTMVMHNETILICGGSYFNSRMSNTTKKECLQLSNGSWLKHSVFNDERIYHSTVTTQTSTFVFGGRERDIIS